MATHTNSNGAHRHKTPVNAEAEENSGIDKSGTAKIAPIDENDDPVVVDVEHYWISDKRYFIVAAGSDDATPDIEAPVDETRIARSEAGHKLLGLESGTDEQTSDDVDERVTDSTRAEIIGGND